LGALAVAGVTGGAMMLLESAAFEARVEPSEEDREHAIAAAVAARSSARNVLIDCKDRERTQAPRLLFLGGPQEGSEMSTKQLMRRGAAGALMLISLGACAGNLGNVLGSVLGGGSQSNQLSGTIRGVDTRSQQLAIQQSNGQTVPVYYDNQTQVVYQNQNYPPTALENGDRVTARVQANGNSYYTDYVQVDQSVSGSGSVSSSNMQLVQGTVRQVDRRNGLFTLDVNNYGTLTVTLPYNMSTSDANRFSTLRSGDFVRLYGTYTNNSQVQLSRFY
jgi:hypothetical protein